MNKTVITVATIAAALSITATGFSQSAQGMAHGKRKGWYKNGKIDTNRDRYNDSRYQTSRYDDRWDTNGRYDSSNGRYGTTGYDSRYENGRYGSTTQQQYDRRQQTKNEWRNIAYAAGAAAVLGLLQKDSRLVFGGAAGAAYALWRYEQDRKSQNSLDRARSRYFDNEYFYRDGVRYDRRTITQNGERYYQFVRAR
ncbi:MAG TPA: hypothetical protein VK934_00355 [Fimbriimonas sp.]|nr:hypothetical protein [Fimbriimonas sp.]